MPSRKPAWSGRARPAMRKTSARCSRAALIRWRWIPLAANCLLIWRQLYPRGRSSTWNYWPLTTTRYIQPNATDAELTFAQQFLNFIDKSRSDPAPGIKLWASFTYAVLITGDDMNRRCALADMMASSAWESRLLALYVPVKISRLTQ